MSFNASEALANEDLDFDLSPYGPKGTVPEPSREALNAYFESLREGAESAGMDRDKLLEAEKLGGSETPAGRATLAEAMAESDPEKLKEMTRSRIAAIADLCAGHPTREEIEQLPYRYQEAFFGWLTERFSGRPTSNGATSD